VPLLACPLRHSTPAVAAMCSSTEKRRTASVRLIARPAPCEQEWNDSGLPLPRTMNDFAPIEPGMMPSSPAPALTAPLRVTHTLAPKCVYAAT
jgi:hypothetical protein